MKQWNEFRKRLDVHGSLYFKDYNDFIAKFS